jgi:hypothetical protein
MAHEFSMALPSIWNGTSDRFSFFFVPFHVIRVFRGPSSYDLTLNSKMSGRA